MRTLGGLSRLTWTNPRPKKRGRRRGEGDQNSNANEMDLIEDHLIFKGARIRRNQVFIFPPPDLLPWSTPKINKETSKENSGARFLGMKL